MTMAEGVPASPWEERARDWAEVMEGWNGWGVPLYRQVLEHLEVEAGTDLLDVGCGAGRFARMAADRGANVAGVDATPTFVQIASERVRAGDFRVGDMTELPWEDDSFDVVTGFNSFFIAPDMVAALREARRVARPGARIAMTVFGRPENCQSTLAFASLREHVPPASDKPDAGPEEPSLEARVTAAGLRPVAGGYLRFAEEYSDLETLLRGYLAAPPFLRAMRSVGEQAVRDALARAVRPLETPGGGFRLEEEAEYLVAAA
jgi:ubiquinone/menaquinone biosynthesis C-methylase UbiE